MFSHLIKTATRTFHENPTFETVKSEVINSLFETVRLSVSISPRNLYNSLKVSKNKNVNLSATVSLTIKWLTLILKTLRHCHAVHSHLMKFL